MRERHVIIGRGLAVLVLGALASPVASVGCGGSPPPPQVAAPPPANLGILQSEESSAATSMTFFFRPSAAVASANRPVQQALVSSGYRLVANEQTAHDAELKLDVVIAPRTPANGAYGNGDGKDRGTLSLAVVADGQIIAQRSAAIVFSNRVIMDTDVQPLIAALNALPKVEALVRERKVRGDAQARQRAADEQRTRTEKEEADAEAAWQAARSTDCAAAGTPTACEALLDWAKKNETSTHADEARRILKEAEPKVRLLREAAAWRDAHVDTCKAPKGANDCGGVERYLMVFGNDEHSQEARTLLAASSKKIAALKAEDERRQTVEEKREEQRQQADARRETQQQKAGEAKACRDNCTSKDGFCGVHRDRQKFQDCSVKCIQRRCN